MDTMIAALFLLLVSARYISGLCHHDVTEDNFDNVASNILSFPLKHIDKTDSDKFNFLVAKQVGDLVEHSSLGSAAHLSSVLLQFHEPVTPAFNRALLNKFKQVGNE
ncbi:hypothetical protein KIN20_023387 [Parelaphostrongylus tenuis]|uniref:Uncharacterized protein n=1 Tax=Parelaphostrongylus tenuis TaxID=148309 RepID=A0AAD5N736_PARTN|nr:hypothetical protein KIN20_023387 [Parelaphostrongylus tenuis]